MKEYFKMNCEDLFLISTIKAWITLQLIIHIGLTVGYFMFKHKIWPYS